jgi:prepilin-type N-terminal cleavage/methylation domain-containing protein
MKRRSGFTLIELITATAISSIVLAAIGSLLMGSFQIVRLLDSRKDAVLEKALIGVELMCGELQKSPVYASLPMEGASDKLSFTQTVTNSTMDPYKKTFKLGQIQDISMSGTATLVRKVEYAFAEDVGAFVRRTDSGSERVLAEHVSSLKFYYALSATKTGGPASGGKLSMEDELEWEWTDKMKGREDESRLKAIRVMLEFNKDGLRYILPGVEKTFLVLREGNVK